jgi:hypothetical protein
MHHHARPANAHLCSGTPVLQEPHDAVTQACDSVWGGGQGGLGHMRRARSGAQALTTASPGHISKAALQHSE